MKRCGFQCPATSAESSNIANGVAIQYEMGTYGLGTFASLLPVVLSAQELRAFGAAVEKWRASDRSGCSLARNASGTRSARHLRGGPAGDLSPVVKKYPARVYVPNSGSNTVDVIDPSDLQDH